MSLENKIEQRNKLMHDAAQILQSTEVTVEQRSAANQMLADVDVLEADIASLRRIAKFEEEQRGFNPAPRNTPGQNAPVKTVEERKAAFTNVFKQFARHGMNSLNAEQRDLLTTSVATGGALIPQDFYPVLVEAQKFYGPIAAKVKQRVTDNNGAQIKISLVNDTTNGFTLIGEGTAVAESDPVFSNKLLSVDTVTAGLVKVSFQELDDSAFDLDAWLRGAFAKRYGRSLEIAVTTGEDKAGNALPNMGGGLIAAAAAGATSAAPTTIAYADFVAMYGALDPAYMPDAAWSFNSTTRASLLGILDGFGRPLYVPSVNSDTLDTILGKPVIINQALPSVAATSVSVLFGDYEEGFLLRTDGAPSILRLNERYADTLEVGFYLYNRLGGVSLDAGTHPIIKLTQHA